MVLEVIPPPSPGPQASTIQNPVIRSGHTIDTLEVTFTKTRDSMVGMTNSANPQEACFVPNRKDAHSYKFLSPWVSGRPRPPTELTASDACPSISCCQPCSCKPSKPHVPGEMMGMDSSYPPSFLCKWFCVQVRPVE